MQVLVVTAAADQTGRTISLLVAGLVGIAVALAALTVWYWRHTDPKRRARPRSIAEPGPVEMLDPRIDTFDQVDQFDRTEEFAAGPSRDLAPVGRPRPAVASIPPSSFPPAPLPPATAPSSTRADDRVADVGPATPGRWVDPDVWVDAFASDPNHGAMSPGPRWSPGPSRPAPPRVEADSSSGASDPVPGSRARPAEQERHPADRQPGQGEPKPGSAGHSLSDDEWAAITQAAFKRFAETESDGSVEVTDQYPVR